MRRVLISGVDSDGERSFLTFTHEKGVLVQSRASAARLLYPPYGARFERMLAFLHRIGR